MNRNDQQFMAQKIRTQYMEKTPSELDALRELDERGAKNCFVRYPDDENDDNLAVLNRLLRAAGFKVIDV